MLISHLLKCNYLRASLFLWVKIGSHLRLARKPVKSRKLNFVIEIMHRVQQLRNKKLKLIQVKL